MVAPRSRSRSTSAKGLTSSSATTPTCCRVSSRSPSPRPLRAGERVAAGRASRAVRSSFAPCPSRKAASATSPSSPTSTTARAPWRTASSSSRAPSATARTGPDPRQDGPGARARHHHQGAERPPHLQGQGRRDLPAQPHRHAGPRRLQLRGLPALSACEGAVLVVDASQGVEAQTLANVYLALDKELEISRSSTRSTCPSADVEGTRARSRTSSASTAPTRSPRSGQDRHRRPRDPRGRSSQRVPPPEGRPGRPPAGRSSSTPGTTATAARRDGAGGRRHAREGRDSIRFMATGARLRGGGDGRLRPHRRAAHRARRRRGRLPRRQHQERRRHQDRRHGDRRARTPATEPLPGFKEVKPMVFAGVFPTDAPSTRTCATRSRSST